MPLVEGSSAHIISAMRQRLAAAGVAHRDGRALKLQDRSHPVVIGRVCDDTPLMRSEGSLGRWSPDRIVRGLAAAALMVGADRVILAVDADQPALVTSLIHEARSTRAEVVPLPPRYPLEAPSLLCDLAGLQGKSVPAAGLDRALVLEARLLVELAGALEGRPALRRVVTVAGHVARPAVLQVPLGAPVAALVEACGGCDDPGWVPYINGLPGGLRVDQDRSVDLDTDGVLIMRHDHPLVRRGTTPSADLLARVPAACVGCRLCTDTCTVFLRGGDLQPHLVLRELAAPPEEPRHLAAAAQCIGCGLCSTLCPTMLRPAELVGEAATRLGLPHSTPTLRLPDDRAGRRQGVGRLLERLGLGLDDPLAPSTPRTVIPQEIIIPAHSPMLGKRTAMVVEGDAVAAGDLVSLAPSGSDEVDMRAPVAGTVVAVDPDDGVTIRPR